MNIVKYFISLWVIISIYFIFSFLAGERGIFAYNQLSLERDKQQKNMEALRLRNEELEGRRNALLYDPDTIIVHARELGYGRTRERFVRIVGLPVTKNYQSAVGQVIIAKEPSFIPEETIRFIAIGAGMGVLICLLIYDFLVKSRSSPPYVSYSDFMKYRYISLPKQKLAH